MKIPSVGGWRNIHMVRENSWGRKGPTKDYASTKNRIRLKYLINKIERIKLKYCLQFLFDNIKLRKRRSPFCNTNPYWTTTFIITITTTYLSDNLCVVNNQSTHVHHWSYLSIPLIIKWHLTKLCQKLYNQS